MDIIIGRDGKTSQLNACVGQKIYRFFTAGSVPLDVSRQHCIVTVHKEGDYTVRNIKATNVTFVNGIEIEEKNITDNDRLELGRGRYLLQLPYIISKIIPPQQQPQKVIDITPLQKVWDDFYTGDLKLQKKQKNIGLLASVPMGLSMFGGLVTGISASLRPYALVFTAVALSVMIYGLYKRYTDNSFEKRQKLKIDFQMQYVCPNPECRHFMGNTPYMSLLNKGFCPYCNAKYDDSKKTLS